MPLWYIFIFISACHFINVKAQIYHFHLNLKPGHGYNSFRVYKKPLLTLTWNSSDTMPTFANDTSHHLDVFPIINQWNHQCDLILRLTLLRAANIVILDYSKDCNLMILHLNCNTLWCWFGREQCTMKFETETQQKENETNSEWS